MTSPRYRAWRFQYPGVDAPPEYMREHPVGLRLTPRGSIDMVEGDESVRQAILLLISTVPGERVMRPTYGCLLHRLIFSPNDDTTAGLAIYYVRRALEQWEPRIDILRIDADQNPDDPSRLDVTLDYRVRATQQVEALAFSLNLAGGEV